MATDRDATASDKTSSPQAILLLIRFNINGSQRFLSHAETLKLFQRSFVRAGVRMEYTKGFNPHPKLSLPLPRPVGVEADEELLCLRIYSAPAVEVGRVNQLAAQEHKTTAQFCDSIKTKLSEHLPQGIDLLSISMTTDIKSFQPCSATYILPIRTQYFNGKLKSKIENILASESQTVRRKTRLVEGRSRSGKGVKNPKFKEIDVRPFLESIELKGNDIVVKCKISPAGSIRLDEILELLGLNYENLASPIKRKNIEWV